MSAVDVLSYLQSKGLVLKKAGGDEIHTHCFYCGEDPSARGRLYVNINADADIPGLHECKLCGAKGALPTIQRHFGDKPEKGEKEEEQSLLKREILVEAATFYHELLLEDLAYVDVLRYLMGPERGLTIETIERFQIGYAPGGMAVYKHLKNQGYRTHDITSTGLVAEYGGKLGDTLGHPGPMITIPYKVVGNIVGLRGRAHPFDGKGSKYKTPPGNPVRLFNSDATWDQDEIIVCEGEFDAMILIQAGFENVVALPGANVFQEAWVGYFTQAKKIFTVFDNDAAGMKGQLKLEKEFGAKIKPVVLSAEGKMDPTQWFAQGHTPEEFGRILKDTGKSGLLISVDEAHEEHRSVQGLEGVKFGLELLDIVISPGILPGQVMIVLAKAGTGKTLFLLNTFHRMSLQPGQEDMKFLFVSLEQTRGDWFERARRIHRFYNLDATDEDALDYWRDRLMIVDKNRLNEVEFLQVLDDYEERMGCLPDVVAVDYLGYWAQAFRGDRYERVSDAVMSLKAVAKEKRLTIITPHQVSRIAKYGEEPDTDAARDAGVVEETADFLLTLWSPDAQLGRPEEEKQGIVNMRVGKSRHGGRGTKLSLQFAPLTLALVPVGDKLQQRARDELGYEQRRDDWEQAIWRHRTGIQTDVRRPHQEEAF